LRNTKREIVAENAVNTIKKFVILSLTRMLLDQRLLIMSVSAVFPV